MIASQHDKSSCVFAVLFQRPVPLTRPRLTRTEIITFIREGKLFAGEPRYKPAGGSEELTDPNWCKLDISLGSGECDIAFMWVDCNHACPYSNDPIKRMAQGVLDDARRDVPETLIQRIANSTDAICLFADARMRDECRDLLDKLKHFMAQRLNGVLLDPLQGFFDTSLQPLFLFPSDATLSAPGTMLIGKPKSHFDGMAVSPDGTKIGTAGDPGNKASIWDARTGELIHSLVGHKKSSRAIAFSSDATTVATGGVDSRVILWNSATGQAEKILLAHSGVVGAVSFSADGRLLASGGYDGKVILWELPSGKMKSTISVHGLHVIGLTEGDKWLSSDNKAASVCSVAFSPDGALLASGGTDGTVRIVAIDSGRLVNTLEGYKESAWPVAFTPDGKQIAAGSYDRKVRLWDVANGNAEEDFANHGHYVFALAFSPDGTKLATGSSDTLVRIWDVATKSRLRTYFGHRDAINSIAFFPDGKRIATAGSDGTVRVWTLEVRGHHT